MNPIVELVKRKKEERLTAIFLKLTGMKPTSSHVICRRGLLSTKARSCKVQNSLNTVPPSVSGVFYYLHRTKENCLMPLTFNIYKASSLP